MHAPNRLTLGSSKGSGVSIGKNSSYRYCRVSFSSSPPRGDWRADRDLTGVVVTPLLQRNHDTRWSLHAADDSLKRNITRAKTRWNCQIKLIKTGAGQARKSRRDTHV